MMVATKFSTSKAVKLFGDKSTPIENTIKGMAEAFKKILVDQDFDVNEVEIVRWCEFQYNRRYRTYIPKAVSMIPKTITTGTLITNFMTYMGNWYDTHSKWLRANKS